MRLVATAALVLALSAAAPARAETQTASLGAVTATLSFRSDEGVYRDLRLRISRSGRLLYDAAPADMTCNDGCFPGRLADGRSVHVRDLDQDGEPEVIADLYSGGAHCCWLARVYSFDGSAYRETTHGFGNAAYRLGDIDGDRRAEIVSSDDRLAYRFAAYAFSVFPVQIWSYADGSFSDTTDRFRARVRADAARTWRVYREAYRRREFPPRGAAAAWAADEYRLGKRASALRTLRKLANRGELPGGPPRSQARFVQVLDAALRRLGYPSS
jgi:hypothetical protein